MEFVKYSREDQTATVKMHVKEIADVITVLAGVRSTFPSQDPTIFLGVNETRLEELRDGLLYMIQSANKAGR